MVSLNIPKRNDPFARIALVALFAAALGVNVSQFRSSTPAQASPGYTIIEGQATATPALPTPALGFALALPTPTPAMQVEQLDPNAPVLANWLDQQLDQASNSAEQFARDQAAALAAEQASNSAEQFARDQAAALADEQAQYIANVGAQAQHSPRGDSPAQPPSYSSGPVAQPAANGAQIIIDPRPAPALADVAHAVPPISAEQAAVLAARQSNGCAAGQIFYPRTGCHTPGSGGAQPGAVSESRP
jgi:hypothetical protein